MDKTFKFFGRIITIYSSISAAITKTVEIDLDKIKKDENLKCVNIESIDILKQWKDKLIIALKARQEACRKLLIENAENIHESLVSDEHIPYTNKKGVMKGFNIKSYDAMEDMIELLETSIPELVSMFEPTSDQEINDCAYHMARQASKAIAWLPFDQRKNDGTVSYEMLTTYLDHIKEQKLLSIR